MKKINTRNKMKSIICMVMIMMWIMITAIPAMAAPKIRDAEYEGKGRVEVDFNSKVKYKNVKVTVKDNKGADYTAVINEKDNDDLTFTIKNFKTGRTYTYTIKGVKKTSDKNFGQVTGKISIPGATTAPKVKDADYDRDDREVEFEFTTKVQWKNAKVTISDGKQNYVVRVLDKEDDSIEVKVKKMTTGKRYSYNISGIRVKGTGAYKTISGTFVARDN